jgi:hypothetical protein
MYFNTSLGREVKPPESLRLTVSTLDMLVHELAEPKLDRLRSAVECAGNGLKRQVVIPAKTDHLSLLLSGPAVIIALGEGTRGGNRALRSSARGTSLHFVVRQCLLSHNRIRFECIFLDCRKKGLNLRPTANKDAWTYKAGALPLSYDGREKASTRDRTEVSSFKGSRPNHWTIEANTSSGIRTHEV